jgi:aspartate-semialdehyde dehydrogenase
MILTTLQAISGAGYPGPSTYDLLDNIVPLIKGEKKNLKLRPQRIFGTYQNGAIVSNTDIKISAHCTRVPVIDGHTACVSVEFEGKKPTEQEFLIAGIIIALFRANWVFHQLPKRLLFTGTKLIGLSHVKTGIMERVCRLQLAACVHAMYSITGL